MDRPFLIGVAGGNASGKLAVCQKIVNKLHEDNDNRMDKKLVVISQESFYREWTQAGGTGLD